MFEEREEKSHERLAAEMDARLKKVEEEKRRVFEKRTSALEAEYGGKANSALL